jgi:hypothetical protein
MFVLAAGIDRRVGLLVHIACDPVAVFGTPCLLITGAPPIIVGQRCLRHARVRVMAVKIALVNSPATERGDVGVVGACRAFRSPASHEEAGVPAERPLVEIGERWLSTEIVLAQPADEPIEFTGSVRAIGAALTSLTFAFVAEEWIDEIRDGRALLAEATTVCVRSARAAALD